MSEEKDKDMAVVLARMDERLAGLVRALEDGNKTFKESLKDHEGRIRALEKFTWGIPGSILLGIASLAFAVIK